MDAALARAFLYQFLAHAYTDPSAALWEVLCQPASAEALAAAAMAVAGPASLLAESARTFQEQLRPQCYEAFLNAYLSAFGHAARGRCPLNEIEYGDLKADPLFQPHRLADLAAFYRAFGMEVSGNAGERQDHLGVELEFMCVLAAKEAYALEHRLAGSELEICRDAQKKFLREHLGRWAPAFTRRLARSVGHGPLAALAHLTRAMVETDCARFGFAPGSDDLVLRPVNAAAESLCASCELTQLPPGACVEPA
jgi:DMSO reductase family type II enzyme chaperone